MECDDGVEAEEEEADGELGQGDGQAIREEAEKPATHGVDGFGEGDGGGGFAGAIVYAGEHVGAEPHLCRLQLCQQDGETWLIEGTHECK